MNNPNSIRAIDAWSRPGAIKLKSAQAATPSHSATVRGSVSARDAWSQPSAVKSRSGNTPTASAAKALGFHFSAKACAAPDPAHVRQLISGNAYDRVDALEALKEFPEDHPQFVRLLSEWIDASSPAA